jgi:two-component system sensor histidine kinase ChiS
MRPAFILLDVMMPKMDGFETSLEIRKLLSIDTTPILFLTAKTDKESLLRGFEVGGNDYIHKPFSEVELFSRLKVTLEISNYNKHFRKFVPWEALELLQTRSIFEIKAGDSSKYDLTTLFADIRGYSTFLERMAPEEGFRAISGILNRYTPFVTSNKGWVNQIIGDCIFGCFPTEAEDAISCAAEMIRDIDSSAKSHAQSSFPMVDFAIGISSGPSMIGWVGDERRLELTASSDAVNVASRLEAVAKLYGARVVFSQATLARVKNQNKWDFRYLGTQPIKGRNQLEPIYELITSCYSKLEINVVEYKTQFESAVKAYEAGDISKARSGFEELSLLSPDDRVVSNFLLFIDSKLTKAA